VKRAGDIEIGDVLPAGRVTGWFFPARGGICLEYAGRWHTHSLGELLEVLS